MAQFEILHFDNHLIVVNKPIGLATHSDQNNDKSLTSAIRLWIQKHFDKPSGAFAEPIHRLDKVTSGLVVFAKTSKALSRLVKEVREGRFEKTYLALVQKGDIPSKGTLKHDLKRLPFRAAIKEGEGVAAVTEFEVIAVCNGFSLLQLRPITGRYHQLRAQLAHMGWPICGDGKYGASSCLDEGIFLHHFQCRFLHPVNKTTAIYQAPLPPNWPAWAIQEITKTRSQAKS